MKTVDRQTVFRIKPRRTPCESRDRREDGGLDITVLIRKPRWHRLLGDRRTHESKRYELDTYGRQVYEACNGRRTVAQIIRAFADENHVSQAEAELAVTTFLRTLAGRGLVVLPKPATQAPDTSGGPETDTSGGIPDTAPPPERQRGNAPGTERSERQ